MFQWLLLTLFLGQEEENADFLEKNKVAVWIKDSDDIKYYLDILLNDPNILNNMRENTFKIAKPNSTKDICDIIFSYGNTKSCKIYST